jgi:hypothetical protein
MYSMMQSISLMDINPIKNMQSRLYRLQKRLVPNA